MPFKKVFAEVLITLIAAPPPLHHFKSIHPSIHPEWMYMSIQMNPDGVYSASVGAAP